MILRSFNLLQGSDNAPVAVNAIRGLLQLPQVGFSSDFGKQQLLHFTRFSIDYLRRAGLLDDKGNPFNLFGIASHLYYHEPGNLALVALIRQGVLHRICGQNSRIAAQREFVLLMCHLFGRRYLPRSYASDENLQQLIKKSPSMVLLPALPKNAKKALQQHDRDILSVFSGYAMTYATQHSDTLGPDTELPLSGSIRTRPSSSSTPFHIHLRRSAIDVRVRSLFAANSGHDDTFNTVEELSQTARDKMHLNRYAIPAMTKFIPSKEKSSLVLNAYLLDFFIHGQTAALKKANGIRGNDVWYLLEDFSLTLKTIRANVIRLLEAASKLTTTDAGLEEDDEEDDELDSGYGTYDSGDIGGEAEEQSQETHLLARLPGVSDEDWRVYEVIHAVTEEFETKFKAMWA